jgi:hypothetical protein
MGSYGQGCHRGRSRPAAQAVVGDVVRRLALLPPTSLSSSNPFALSSDISFLGSHGLP